MRLRLPGLNTVERLLKEQTGQIVAQVMTEVSGSNFALEIKDMVVDELEPKVKTFAQEAIAEFITPVFTLAKRDLDCNGF